MDISRYILAPAKEELDSESKLTFVYEIDFVNLGQGRPKANKITIDLVEQKNPQGKLFWLLRWVLRTEPPHRPKREALLST